MLITPSGKHVHGWYLGIAVCEFGKDTIKEFQVIQESMEKIRIKVVPEPDFDEKVIESIRENIRERGYEWDIDLEIVDSLDRTRAGKYKWVINRLLP